MNGQVNVGLAFHVDFSYSGKHFQLFVGNLPLAATLVNVLPVSAHSPTTLLPEI